MNGSDNMDDLVFWSIAAELRRRTVVVSPHSAPRARAWVAERGLQDRYRVAVSPLLRDDQIAMVDADGMEAERNRQRIRQLRRRH